MDELVPQYDDVPVDASGEPEDAEVEHLASEEEVKRAIEAREEVEGK